MGHARALDRLLLCYAVVLLHLGLSCGFIGEVVHLRIFVDGTLVVERWLLDVVTLEAILGHAGEEGIEDVQLTRVYVLRLGVLLGWLLCLLRSHGHRRGHRVQIREEVE